MTALAAFQHSLGDSDPPPDLDNALLALWWSRKPDWARAHGYAQQQEGDPACDWVHAHLHRIEGDMANAAYWYRRANKPVGAGPVEQEWQAIASTLLERA